MKGNKGLIVLRSFARGDAGRDGDFNVTSAFLQVLSFRRLRVDASSSQKLAMKRVYFPGDSSHRHRDVTFRAHRA